MYGNYDVLDTDYTTYAYVYTKSSGIFGLGIWFAFEYTWVLTREPLI